MGSKEDTGITTWPFKVT